MATTLLTALLATVASAAELPTEVPLGNPVLAATEAARADLKYLAHCALDHHTVLVADHAGQRYRFAGQIGLAPRWHAQDMTRSEQQWVSACMLALQNHEGVKVEVSLLLSHRPNPGVRGGWLDVSRQYPIAEGRYFGNLFLPQPVAYVCSPAWTAEQEALLRQRHRLCALPGAPDADGRRQTVCEMEHVGACTDGAFQRDGTRFDASVQVFLPR